MVVGGLRFFRPARQMAQQGQAGQQGGDKQQSPPESVVYDSLQRIIEPVDMAW